MPNLPSVVVPNGATSRSSSSFNDVKLFGLLITKDDHESFSDWCEQQLPLYDAVVCLDGSVSVETARLAERYDERLIYLHERDFSIPHKTDHGLRRIVHAEILRRFGSGHWVMCCHADELCYHDPRKIAARAQSEGFDQVSWFSPHFYPHPDELPDWSERRNRPFFERFHHYHWSYHGDGLPWLEDRLYRAGDAVDWDDRTHGNVRPHGVMRPAPFHPILRHYKVVLTDPAGYEREERCAHYRHHWEGLEHRTGLPFPVRQLEDLFVRSVPKYARCDRFEGTFAQPWNIGEQFRPNGHAGREVSDVWALYRQVATEAVHGDIDSASLRLAELCRQTNDPKLQALVTNDLAVLAAMKGNLNEAVAGLQSALQLDPQCDAARINLAEVQSPHQADSSLALDSSPASSMTAPIKVAILSFLFNWPSTGGGIVHTVELAHFLAKAGYDVAHFYAQFAPWSIGAVTAPTPMRSNALSFTPNDWHATAIQGRFRQTVDAFQPDYVILTDSWNFKPLLAEAVRGYPYFMRLQALECLCPLNNVRLLPEPGGRFRQCPLHQLAVPSECDRCVGDRGQFSGSLHQAERALSGVGTSEYHEKLRRAFAEAEAVLVVNPLAEAMVSPFAKQVRVVTAGMDPARFPWPAPAEQSLKTPGKIMILFAGIPEEWMKGFHVLRDAAARLWKRRRDFEIVATGEPSQQVDPFIRYVGWQSQEELPRYLRGCDILVMPTIAQEALGRTAVEAMATGRPVVASRIGGLPFTVLDGATGLLSEPGNAEDLARQLEALIQSPERREQMGKAGRLRFEEHYAWPVIIDRHYRPLLRECRRLPTGAPSASGPAIVVQPASALRECTARDEEFRLLRRDDEIQLCSPCRGAVDRDILGKFWVQDIYRLRRITESIGCVVDLGAHVGAFSIQANELWPEARIVACEADPQNADLLRRNVRNRPKISVVEAALVADNVESVVFFAVSDKTAQNSGGGSIHRPEPNSVPISVAARSVARFWEENSIAPCDLLKLDCEGSEPIILQALADAGLLSSVRRIVGEWHAPDGAPETIERVQRDLKAVLVPTHDVEFDLWRTGREGHFSARRRQTDVEEPIATVATAP
jgi:FkbM family methyltransferase